MNMWLKMLIVGSCFVLLAVYGAGIFPWTVLVVSVLLCLLLQPWLGLRHLSDIWHVNHLSPGMVLLIYLAVMLMPLPPLFDRLGGQRRAEQHQVVIETLDALGQIDIDHGIGTPMFSLTRSRAGTFRFVSLMILMFAGYRVVLMLSTAQRMLMLRMLVFASSAMAVLGVLGKWVIPQGDTLWWWIPIPHGRPGSMGGFMNRNHFAGYCALLVPAAVALGVGDATKRRWWLFVAQMLAALVLAAGVLLALSRGGFLALLAGVMCLLLVMLMQGKMRLRYGLLFVFGLAAVVLIACQLPQVRQRLSSIRSPMTTTSIQHRLEAWHDAIHIWRAYPLMGSGPNAFRVVYPQHRTSSHREARDFAENEYVQWLSETGIAGILMALFFATCLCRDVWSSARAVSTSEQQTLLAAAMGCLVAAACHACVDFPMHLPLYGLTVAWLAAFLKMPSDAAVMRRVQNQNAMSVKACERPPVPHAGVGLVCLLTTLTLIPFDLQLDMAGRVTRADLAGTVRALVAAPTSPIVWRRLAAVLWQQASSSARLLSERCLTHAADYDQNNYPLWRRLGDVRREMGQRDAALEAYHRVKALRSWVPVPTRLPEDD